MSFGSKRNLLLALLGSGILLSGGTARADDAKTHFDKARAFYNQWLKDSRPELLDSAFAEMLLARKSRPRDAAIVEWLGFIELKQQKYADALELLQEAIRLKPNLPEQYVNLGAAYAGLKRYTDAANAYGEATRLAPKDFTLRERYAEALAEAGRSEDALAQFAQSQTMRQAAGQDAATPVAVRYRHGLILARLSRWADAEPLFAKAAEQDPENADVLKWLGYAELQQAKYAPAADSLSKAIALQPDLADTHLNLARAYEGLERYDAASAELETAAKLKPDLALIYFNAGAIHSRRKLYTPAAEAYKKALSLDPNAAGFEKAQVYSALGYALHQTGKRDEAIAAYEQAALIEPKSGATRNNLAALYFEAAQAAQTRTAWQKAVDALKTAQELNPNAPKIHDNYAFALSQLNRKQEAVTQYNQGVSLDDKPYDFLVDLATSLDIAQRLPEAEKVYQRANQVYQEKNRTDNALLLKLLGEVQRKQKETEAADQTYARLIALEPTDMPVYLVRYNLLKQLKRDADALAALEMAIRMGDQAVLTKAQHTALATMRRELAYLYSRKGDKDNLERARQTYLTALRKSPDNARVHNGLGVVLLKQNQPKAALDAFKKAVALDPKYDEAVNNLGVAYERTDQTKDAVANYRKALALNPANALAKQNLARLTATPK